MQLKYALPGNPWAPGYCLTEVQAEGLVDTFIQSSETNGNQTTQFNTLIQSVANPDD